MNQTRILVLSLIANCGLVAAFAALVALRPATSSTSSPEPESAATVITNMIVQAAPAAAVAPGPSVVRINWSGLESSDYRVYIANLRAAGCPEETIRDIIIADVNKLYAGKWHALRMQRAAEWKFWESDVKNAKSNAQNQTDRKQLETEQAALVKELLGVDLKSELSKYVWDTNSHDERYAFLAENKQAALKEIYARYRTAQGELLAAAKAAKEPKDITSRKLEALRDQRNLDMANVMTPAENVEYALRHSSLAGRMRSDLGEFAPSEAEFRALYQVLSAAEASTVSVADGKSKPLDFNAAVLQEEIRRAIGDARYGDFAKANDPQAREILRLTQRYGLTPEEAGKVSVVNLIAQQELERVLNDPNVTSAQKATYKKQVDQEKKRILTETLSAHAKSQKSKTL